GGHDDVVAAGAGAHLGHHRLVGIVAVERDLHAVGLLELLDQLGAGVVAPVVDVQLAGGTRGAEAEQDGGGSGRPEQSASHSFSPRGGSWSRRAYFFRAVQMRLYLSVTSFGQGGTNSGSRPAGIL